MSYQPLAVKYRPQNFEQLVGQEATALALSNAVRLSRIPNAVILSGIRGTGKTTVARIFAKALNCSNPQNGSPCLVCDNCRAISAGIHEDVVEIDGASNTGVDDIRALKETVVYVPQRGKYKIYIIDEVHMLSTSAFNALLKTLEEPPSNVVFIFATTEIQKIPETIISRCQTFFLEKISYQDIYNRLNWILNQESIPFDEKALKIIVKEAGGSMRDALTLLDKTIVLGGGQVDLESIGKISASGSSLCLDLLSYLQRKDRVSVFSTLSSLEQSGIDLSKVIEELCQITRHCFIIRDLEKDLEDLHSLGIDEVEYDRLNSIAKVCHPLELNTLFRLLVKCRADLTKTDLDRYIIENYLMEWCLIPYKNPFKNLDNIPANGTSNKPDTDNIQGSNQNFDINTKSTSSYNPPSYPSTSTSTPSNGKKLAALNLDLSKTNSIKPNPLESSDKVQSDLSPNLTPSSTTVDAPSSDEILSSSDYTNQFQEPTHSILSKVLDSSSDLISSCDSEGQDSALNSTEVKTSVQSPSTKVQEVLDSKKTSSTIFPETWDELVETWKGKKPFQARILEETICTHYSRDSITLLINKSSLAACQLLQEQQKKSIEQSFKVMFGFQGKLLVTTQESSINKVSLPECDLGKSQDTIDKNPSLIDNVEGAVSQEYLSILDKKKIARQQREKFLNEQIAGNCITGIIGETFKNSKITSITVDE